MEQKVKSWTDVKEKIQEQAFPGIDADLVEDKSNIFNKPLIFEDVVEREGDQGTYAHILAKDNGKLIRFSFGGVVGRSVLRAKKEEQFPFKAQLVKRKSQRSGREYFDLEGV